MSIANRGNLVWLGMIFAGIALGAYVLASWPDTTPRLVPLPYGESMPKTPRAQERATRAPAATRPARQAPVEAFPWQAIIGSPPPSGQE